MVGKGSWMGNMIRTVWYDGRQQGDKNRSSMSLQHYWAWGLSLETARSLSVGLHLQRVAKNATSAASHDTAMHTVAKILALRDRRAHA